MPQIKTRGKNPGISLVQGEATRWRATIEDIKAIRRNESDAKKLADLDMAGNALDRLLALYGPKEQAAAAPETTKTPDRKAG